MAIPPRAGSKGKLPTLRFYGEEVVFDTVSGLFYRMTPTACRILRALDAGAQPRELPAMLEADYAFDRATAARDVELFLNELAALEPLNRLHPGNREQA